MTCDSYTVSSFESLQQYQVIYSYMYPGKYEISAVGLWFYYGLSNNCKLTNLVLVCIWIFMTEAGWVLMENTNRKKERKGIEIEMSVITAN